MIRTLVIALLCAIAFDALWGASAFRVGSVLGVVIHLDSLVGAIVGIFLARK